jgi:hypothetical protein
MLPPCRHPRDHAAEAEQFLTLGHDHRAIGSRKGGDEMGDVENGLVQ